MTYSGLGQDAPLEAKEGWDPDRAKRTALQKTLQAALPGLSINLGGTTSIDVTRAGVDKGYGLKRLSKESGVPLAGMLFVGDASYHGGNDYPAAELGIDTLRVSDVADTHAVVSATIPRLQKSQD